MPKYIPKVTIITATYNRASFIAETLESIRTQVFTDWECLIIDDGGTDNTAAVIAPVLNQDKRFQFLKRPETYQKGLPGCRNYGLDLAKAEYIIFFDDDDFVHPDNLKSCMDVFEQTSVDFCHYQKVAYSNQQPSIERVKPTIERYLNKADIEELITQKIGLASCTVMWRKSCFDYIRFNEGLLYAEEWECYIRLILENFRGVIISNVLYYNRKHANSNTAEFYRNSPIRRASKKDAILLVLENLKEKKLLSRSIIRYFVTQSLDFKEYNLFIQIIDMLQLSISERVRWYLFYGLLPLRLLVYRFKKALKKI